MSREDACVAPTGGRLGQRDGSLTPVGGPLSFAAALFALMRWAFGVREPSDDRLRPAQREAVARINRMERSVKLGRFALLRGVSSSTVGAIVLGPSDRRLRQTLGTLVDSKVPANRVGVMLL